MDGNGDGYEAVSACAAGLYWVSVCRSGGTRGGDERKGECRWWRWCGCCDWEWMGMGMNKSWAKGRDGSPSLSRFHFSMFLVTFCWFVPGWIGACI